MTLDSYVEPTLEASGTMRRIVDDLVLRMRPNREKRISLYDKLWNVDETIKAKIAPPPACGPLIKDLNFTIRDWLLDNDADESARLIVYPPGHRAMFLRRWAKLHDADIIEAPRWGESVDLDAHLAALHNGRLVVLPCLQDWFRRNVGGMDLVRTVLVAVSRSPDKVVIGCDSWAWQFLIKSVDAHHLLPEALVFQAFGADSLRDWFRTLAETSELDVDVRFRSARDGSDIFDGDGDDTYFQDLSAKSLGIPWVAWAIWRDSLFTTKRDGLDESIWVRRPHTPNLPDTDERESLLILHALLIHDGLDVDALSEVLPFVGSSTTLAMLQRAGFLVADEDVYRVARPAYPTVKSALEDAGYPGDGL